jgi:RNA-directed DNA polymerase
MLRLTLLRAATSLHEFAALLDFKPGWLTYILYVQQPAAKYKSFEIPKKTGGVRTISAPREDLKLLQRRLADLLQDCVDEINKDKGRQDGGTRPDKISHGFKRRRSIITNAQRHRHRRYVFNADIANFFGTINFGRVRGFFISDRNFQLNPRIATLIAQIACFENSLPQGSPCSPVISNLIGHVLDIHLAGLAAKVGCAYSRYADDLTFSTNDKQFPFSIAVQDEVHAHKWIAGSELLRIVALSGFTLNAAKTRMQYLSSRQEVTGLVVNKVINVRSEYRRTTRAMVHNLLKSGEYHFHRKIVGKDGKVSAQLIPGRPRQLEGILGFIDQVDRLSVDHAKRKKSEAYRRFLVFDRFFRTDRAVLICEGKTDNVYLAHAIRSLATQFPELATSTTSGKIELRISRFRYSGTSTNRILGLNGGSADLGHFLRLYRAEVERISAAGMQHPVIVLIDNDSGSNPVYNTIKQLTGKKPSGGESYIHVVRNLYVVATPITAPAKESKIEDFFPQDTLKTLIGGKRFNPSNDYDVDTEYGKADFAFKIVEPNAATIDFSGFAILLQRIVEVIHHHDEKIVPLSPPSAP